MGWLPNISYIFIIDTSYTCGSLKIVIKLKKESAMKFFRPKNNSRKIKNVDEYIRLCEIERLVKSIKWNHSLSTVRGEMVMERILK